MNDRQKWNECERRINNPNDPYCTVTRCVDCEFKLPYETMKAFEEE